MSVYSRTTTGGANFDLLCTGDVRNYSFNPANIAGEKKVKHIKQKLVKKLKDTVTALQIGSSKKIAKIYIGKTFIRQRKNTRGGYITFDPLDHNTWRNNGISSRWCEHRKKKYGKDGLVVYWVPLLERQCQRDAEIECTKNTSHLLWNRCSSITTFSLILTQEW